MSFKLGLSRFLRTISFRKRREIKLISVGSVESAHGGKTMGGVARFNSTLARTWFEHPELGINVVGIVATNSDLSEDPVTGVTYFHNLNGESHPKPLTRIIEEHKPDCILFHHISHAWAASIADIQSSTHMMGFAHSWINVREGRDKNFPHKLNLVKKSLTRLDHLLFLSDHCRNEMNEFMLSPTCSISVVPPPLPQLNKALDIQKSGFDREIGHIVYLGNLLEHKNPMPLVEAINLLKETTLTIIGSGQQHDEIKDFVRKNKLADRINLLGNISDGEISKIMLKADVFCLPSHYEAFGLVYLEALEHGLPVIGYGPSITAIEKEMKIKCGIPLKNYDSLSIANAIEECMDIEWKRTQIQKIVTSTFNPYSISKRMANIIHSSIRQK